MFLERLLFPRRCVACERKWGAYLCAECFSAIPFCTTQYCSAASCYKPAMHGMTHPKCRTRTGISGHISVTLYNGVMEHILEYYKRRGVFALEAQLSDIVGRYFFDTDDSAIDLLDDPMVVPVPQFKYEAWFRSYNVAERLASMFAQHTDLKARTDVLYKHRPTFPQKHLSREKRLKNLDSAFRVENTTLVMNQDIILVDDVWTTGATLRECAKTLKKAGAKEVWAVTLCRGI